MAIGRDPVWGQKTRGMYSIAEACEEREIDRQTLLRRIRRAGVELHRDVFDERVRLIAADDLDGLFERRVALTEGN